MAAESSRTDRRATWCGHRRPRWPGISSSALLDEHESSEVGRAPRQRLIAVGHDGHALEIGHAGSGIALGEMQPELGVEIDLFIFPDADRAAGLHDHQVL